MNRISGSRASAARLTAAAVALMLAACGGGSDYYYADAPVYSAPPAYASGCGSTAVPSVVVRFYSAVDGQAVDAQANGTLRSASGTAADSSMIAWETSGATAGYAWSIAGGFDRPDTYDVYVTTAGGEQFAWQDVVVGAASCGPATVVLDAHLTRY